MAFQPNAPHQLTVLPFLKRRSGTFRKHFRFSLITTALLDRGWSMKLTNGCFFAVCHWKITRAQPALCVNHVFACFRSVYRRAGVRSPDARHLGVWRLPCLVRVRQLNERFPNGGESYATTEDRALFGPIFEYVHSFLGEDQVITVGRLLPCRRKATSSTIVL